MNDVADDKLAMALVNSIRPWPCRLTAYRHYVMLSLFSAPLVNVFVEDQLILESHRTHYAIKLDYHDKSMIRTARRFAWTQVRDVLAIFVLCLPFMICDCAFNWFTVRYLMWAMAALAAVAILMVAVLH